MNLSNIDFSAGIVALVLGMTTVFLVLILISAIIGAFKWFDFEQGIRLKIRKKAPVESTDIPIKTAVSNEDTTEEDELEIIAIITAAIAASMNTTTDRLEIISFREITRETRGSWTVR